MPKIYYLRNILASMLPIFAVFSFAITGHIDGKRMRLYSLFALGLAVVKFIFNQKMLIYDAIMSGSSQEEFTNNASYLFVQVLPFMVFWGNKIIIQYLLVLTCFIFTMMGMKRGAIVIGLLCGAYFVYKSYHTSISRQQHKIRIMLAIVITVGIKYMLDLFSSSNYFQSRVEATLEGNSSGRDVIYATLLNHYKKDNSVLHLLLGNGADATVSIAGNFAHNDWLELVINNGLLGVIVYFLFFLTLIKEWQYSAKCSYKTSACFGLSFIILFCSSLFSMSYTEIGIVQALPLGYALAVNTRLCKAGGVE